MARSLLVLALFLPLTACQTPTRAEADIAAGTPRQKPEPPPARRETAPPRPTEPMLRSEEIVRSRYQDALVDGVRALVRHPTFVDERNPDAEPAAREAFMTDLQARAEALGLRFTRITPLVAEVELDGDQSGGPVIGILTHGDVVPPGDGWTHGPFDGALVDGRIYGRGAMDDKGAIMASMVAMAAARDARTPRPFTTRLIVGMAEETTWECMDGYLKLRAAPDFTFVADGSFPVGVGEKGIVGVKIAERFMLLSPQPGRCTLQDITGGVATNVVPDGAQATLQCNGVTDGVATALQAEGLVTTVKADRVTVTAKGRAAHGSTPEQGINALNILLTLLDRHGRLDDAQGGVLLLRFLAAHATDLTGSTLGIQRTHTRFTPTTVNLGKLRIEGSTLIGSLSIRMPPPSRVQDIITAVEERTRAYAKERGVIAALVVAGSGLEPLDVNPDRREVQALLDAYKKVTQRDPRAVTLAGTTYAKALPNAVSFGPEEDGAPERRHAADEYISVQELVELASVYAAALTTLAERTPVTP